MQNAQCKQKLRTLNRNCKEPNINEERKISEGTANFEDERYKIQRGSTKCNVELQYSSGISKT